MIGATKLNFEELTTILVQIDVCLDFRALKNLPESSDELEVLTPGHFLLGRLLSALPDHQMIQEPISLLKRWRLCQKLAHHFWEWWYTEYLISLQRVYKWHTSSRNLRVGDIVCLRDEHMAPTKS